MAANLKQDYGDLEGDSEIVECEVGMAGVKMADGEAEAGPSTRGEIEGSGDASKVCPSSAFKSHVPYAHFVQTRIIIYSPIAPLNSLHITQKTNHHDRRTTSPPPPALQGLQTLPPPSLPALSATSTTTAITPTTTPPLLTTLNTARAP